jgi:hypothetical protein
MRMADDAYELQRRHWLIVTGLCSMAYIPEFFGPSET